MRETLSNNKWSFLSRSIYEPLYSLCVLSTLAWNGKGTSSIQGVYIYTSYIPRPRCTMSSRLVLKPKKLALERPPASHNAASIITAIADQGSSWVATTFSAHSTVRCSVEDINVKFWESRRKIGTIPCRAACMIWCASVHCPWSATGAMGLQYSAVYLSAKLRLQEQFLTEEKWHPPNRSDTCLYDQSFRSQRWARFHLQLILSFSVFPV